MLLGVIGTILHCCRCFYDDPGTGGTTYCFCPCDGWFDLGAGGGEGCVAVIIVLVVIFVIMGIVYGLFAVTVIVQSVWQRHYHILMKRKLTQVLNSCTFNLIAIAK